MASGARVGQLASFKSVDEFFALFANGRRFFPFAAAKIIQFGAASAALLLHLDFCDTRRVQWEYPLDALAVRDAAHGESFVEPATLAPDHYAGKDLDSFLVSFHDASVHAHAVAHRKRFGITFLLFFLNRIDGLIHKLFASRAAAGAHCPARSVKLQTSAEGI